MVGALPALAGVAAWVWIVGSAIARGRPTAERVLAGVLAALALAWLAMLAGAVDVPPVGSTVVTAGVAALVAVAALLLRRPSLRPSRPALLPLTVGGAAALAVSYPMLRLHAGDVWPGHADMLWHSGWTKQLLGGADAPGGVYARVPNDYPWLYHALAAGIAQSLPGGVEVAIVVLQALGLAVGGAGMWLLAGRLGMTERAATWSILFVLAGGGFGWIWQHHPAAVFSLTGAGLGPYHGDLELANAMVPALGNVPPLLPRDLGLMLAPGALWLGLGALDTRRGWPRVGVACGLVYLLAPQAGFFLALWLAVLAGIERAWGAWRALVAGGAVIAVWLLPLAIAYHRYGGFSSFTRLNPVNPSGPEAIVALGLTLPLGALGVVLALRMPAVRTRVLVVALVPSLVTLGVIAAGVGGNVLGTPAILRWLRYLPFVVLGLAIPAGLAADTIVTAVARRVRPLALAAAAALALAATASTWLAVVAVAREPYPRPLICPPLPIRTSDTIAVIAHEPYADFLAYQLFGQTGASFYYLDRIRVKVRFTDWLDRFVPDQKHRHAVEKAFPKGGPPPPGVRWLFVRSYMLPPSTPLPRVATCFYRHKPLAVFRVGPADG
jgi:hypothetical protein